MPGITAHMVVKNEDRFVGYAIKSVLPFVDAFLITDTGSTDHTVEVIKAITSTKIHFSVKTIKSPLDMTNIRNNQIKHTQTPWIWIVDGDEIYPKKLCHEIKSSINQSPTGIVVRRYDLLGDVYHYQTEAVGTYAMYGQSGHFSLRVLNLSKINDLLYRGDYPWEGFYDATGNDILKFPPQQFVFTQNRYWHAGYLKRSSKGASLKRMFNRQKFKIETGLPIKSSLPEVFYQRHQFPGIDSPLQKQGLLYHSLATLITPIKKMKRWLT